MPGISHIEGAAVALPQDNIDTDQLIPARFMSVPRKDGYGAYLLHDQRFDAQGAVLPDMPLNRHPGACVLVTRRNFGSGSSREAAVYALVDFGITAVLAPSFGDIFAASAVNNGLLPARLPEDQIEALIALLENKALPALLDVASGTVRIGELETRFDLDPVWQLKLLNGWDDIDMTANYRDQIHAFRTARATAEPWSMLAQNT